MPRSRGLVGAVGAGISIGQFAASLADAPRKTQRAVRRAIVTQVEPLRLEIARNASWSHKIPDAIKTRVSFALHGQGVTLYIDRKMAPYARPYEGLSSSNGKFRHPVYGRETQTRDQWTWVSEETRPFFFKAVDERRTAVIDAVEKAVLSALP